MTVIIVILSFLALVWALETLFKRDCGRPGCHGWEWTNTGHCSDCRQPVQGTSLAGRVLRRVFGAK